MGRTQLKLDVQRGWRYLSGTMRNQLLVSTEHSDDFVSMNGWIVAIHIHQEPLCENHAAHQQHQEPCNRGTLTAALQSQPQLDVNPAVSTAGSAVRSEHLLVIQLQTQVLEIVKRRSLWLQKEM